MIEGLRHLIRRALRRRIQRPTRSARAGAPQDNPAGAAGAPIDDDAPPRGCAWFDSSHELRQGLVVDEQPDAAALAQLSLGEWLRLELREWPGRGAFGA